MNQNLNLKNEGNKEVKHICLRGASNFCMNLALKEAKTETYITMKLSRLIEYNYTVKYRI